MVKIKNITGNGTVDLSGAQCVSDELAKKTSRFRLEDGDLLMAMTGATVGKIGIFIQSEEIAYLNQRVAKFESKKFGSKISWVLYCCLSRQSVFEELVGAAQGSAQPNISSKGIENVGTVLADDELIKVYISKVDSLFIKWMGNCKENVILEQNRNLLLPRLLSGELTLNSVGN